MQRKRYHSSFQKLKLLDKLKKIIFSIFVCIAPTLADDVTGEYASVIVDVFSEVNDDVDNDIEKARNRAIENGEIEAFQKAAEHFGYVLKQEDISSDKVKQYIDGYSIHDEQIGRSLYKARIEYRISLSSMISTFKRQKSEYRAEDTLIVIKQRYAPPEALPYLHSFSDQKTKFKYDKKLEKFLKKSNIKVYYEHIN